jgi:poly(3-hydroxybutyrate) depolymerase
VYGGDEEYFRSVSPRVLAEQHAAVIAEGSLVRMVCGSEDETFANNRDFHDHLARLGIPHTWTVLPGVDHDPLGTLAGLGDDNWSFYRRAFGDRADGAAPTGRPDIEITFQLGRHERRAVIVNAPVDGATRPAVLVLHGGMGSAAAMRANSGFDAVARAEGFMVVYAEGTSFGAGRHAWNTGFLLRRQVQDADDIAYFDTLIDTLVRDHGADPGRVFMTGGSNGGMMTFVYAVARPERLAAVAPVVASMFSFEARPSVPLPILIINGALDDEVPIEGGMSRNALVRRGQEAPFKPLAEVVELLRGGSDGRECRDGDHHPPCGDPRRSGDGVRRRLRRRPWLARVEGSARGGDADRFVHGRGTRLGFFQGQAAADGNAGQAESPYRGGVTHEQRPRHRELHRRRSPTESQCAAAATDRTRRRANDVLCGLRTVDA